VQTAASNRAAPLRFGGLAGATKVGLTIEPAGGSPQPTTTPVVLFDLPT
jgi:anti-sigma-K factor RskA